jgi:hypothetical protein
MQTTPGLLCSDASNCTGDLSLMMQGLYGHNLGRDIVQNDQGAWKKA